MVAYQFAALCPWPLSRGWLCLGMTASTNSNSCHSILVSTKGETQKAIFTHRSVQSFFCRKNGGGFPMTWSFLSTEAMVAWHSNYLLKKDLRTSECCWKFLVKCSCTWKYSCKEPLQVLPRYLGFWLLPYSPWALALLNFTASGTPWLTPASSPFQ